MENPEYRNRKSLPVNAAVHVFYSALSVFFPLISSSYVSHILLPEGVGQVAYAQNIASYFVLAAALGIPTYGVRQIAKAKDKQSTDRIFSELLSLNTVTTACCLIGYYMFVLTNDSFSLKLTLHLVFGICVALNFFRVDWYYRGREAYLYLSIRSAVVKVLSFIALFVFVKDSGDCVAYAIILCAATGANYLPDMLQIKKEVSFTTKNLHFKLHLRSAITLFACSLATELYSKIDITMLGCFCRDEVVGYYSNAHKLVNTVITLTIAVGGVFLPRLSYYFENDQEKFQKLVEEGLKAILYIAIPAFAGTVFVASEIVPVLFGSSFLSSVRILRILSPLILIKSWGDLLCYQVLIASGREKYLLPSYIAAVVVNVVFNALLIPAFGAQGAAAASVVSELVVNISLLFHVKSFMKAKGFIKEKRNIRYAVSIVPAVILMVICMSGIKMRFSGTIGMLIAEVVSGVFLYAAVTLVLRNEIAVRCFSLFRSVIGQVKSTYFFMEET